ncbi:MAG: hypothetical protein OXN89_05340 [Bryobacterales bacterium]|nr:hypothetical protein [Bryobacterales bacterium]
MARAIGYARFPYLELFPGFLGEAAIEDLGTVPQQQGQSGFTPHCL